MLPEVIRLLREKGVRVRLPLEELAVLMEKEDENQADFKQESSVQDEETSS